MATVFLSSTYTDLVDYRQAVIIALEDAGHTVLCMERFGAHNQTPHTVSPEYVAQCDVYVVLIARRYGSIPAGQSKSMTHLEYDAATVNCKPRLVFTLKEQAAWDDNKEGEEMQRKLRAFSQYIRDNHTCAFFDPNPDDLARKVVRALERWKNRDQLQEWLREVYPKTEFEVEPDLRGVVRASAEWISKEVRFENGTGGPVPIGIAGGPLIRQVVDRIGTSHHDWQHSEWVALNGAGECNHYFYSSNYQCTRLGEISGGTSYASLSKQSSRYESVVSRLRFMVCSCGGTDGFLCRRLGAHCGTLPAEVIGDFCLTPIDEDGRAVAFMAAKAAGFLKEIDPRPHFKQLLDLKNPETKILLPLAKTNDQGVAPVDVKNRVGAVKAVLSSRIVTRCILSEDMAAHLLPPRVRGYQFLGLEVRDAFGWVYHAVRSDKGERHLVRVIDSGDISCRTITPTQVDQEIIINDPLGPMSRDLAHGNTQFLYSLIGSPMSVELSPGVRKPGNWAANTIRIAEEQIDRLKKSKIHIRLLDVGCGSGAIGAFIAKSACVQKVVFADIEERALVCAMGNAEKYGVKDKCTAVKPGDLFSKLGSVDQEFEIVVFTPPFFPELDGLPTDRFTSADLAGPTGNEIALRFVEEVGQYLCDWGCAITYLADYVPHEEIVAKARVKGLTIEKRRITILYPKEPKHRFPVSYEIEYRHLLEQWSKKNNRPAPFTDETWEGRAFLGFDMVFFIMTKQPRLI